MKYSNEGSILKGVHIMNVSVIGIDIAKNVFQLHGIDSQGNVVLKERVSRKKFLTVLSTLPKCLIGMEACSTSNYWGRELTKLGHNVKLVSPQYVKPYVKTNKNDSQDAEAICEAVTRLNMRFVAIKSIEQQDILSLHQSTLTSNKSTYRAHKSFESLTIRIRGNLTSRNYPYPSTSTTYS